MPIWFRNPCHPCLRLLRSFPFTTAVRVFCWRTFRFALLFLRRTFLFLLPWWLLVWPLSRTADAFTLRLCLARGTFGLRTLLDRSCYRLSLRPLLSRTRRTFCLWSFLRWSRYALSLRSLLNRS
jgi:hypothetical protein